MMQGLITVDEDAVDAAMQASRAWVQVHCA
jgi:hypothetical protein